MTIVQQSHASLKALVINFFKNCLFSTIYNHIYISKYTSVAKNYYVYSYMFLLDIH